MKKTLIIIWLTLVPSLIFCQKIEDLFQSSSTKITWLGIDFSHVKLIGDFSQIWGIGSTDGASIKTEYFPAWNNMVYKEPDKYNLIATFRKENIEVNLKDISQINSITPLEDMEALKSPNYTKDDIQKFIQSYNFSEKEGIGLLLVAESLNKLQEMAIYHFVAIDLSNNNILLYDLFHSKAGGFGLRNYWAKTFYYTLDQIKTKKYASWKKEILKK
ncbi:MAG: hypothetical protein M9916_07965 [Crocinitomicaceae bacterium]|nr:hypothetical protein [Crocinitomicaceae bacterium]